MTDQLPVTQSPYDEPVVPHRSAPVGPLRHLLSTVVALLVVPLGYAGLDYAVLHNLNRGVQTLRDGLPPVEALGPFAVGVLLVFIASATGRISGLGPLLAGIAWGVVPGALALVAPVTLAKGVRHLPDVYAGVGAGITSYGVVVFPLVAALLIGAAVSGRWR